MLPDSQTLMEMPGIFMHEEERILIRDLSKEVAGIFNPCNILHVGIGWGGSLYYSRAGAPDANIYGVDIVPKEDLELKGTPEQLAELNLNFIIGDSRIVHKAFRKPIHFLYLDGNHLYDCLIQDIKNWESKVVIGGYVSSHDCLSCHWAPGVNKALYEGLSPKEWEDLGIAGWSRYFRRIA